MTNEPETVDPLEIVARGYFPRELPPPFTTHTFADFLKEQWPSLPTSTSTARLYTHNSMRYGALRRRLGVPNPRLFLPLCRTITDHWEEMRNIFAASHLSASKPMPTVPEQERAISQQHALDVLPYLRAEKRAIGRYLLRADISQFYPSVYTHSVPWAIHGRDVAKSSKWNKALLGNQVDTYVRNAQDGQTRGIPIGPDTSLVVSEVLLCRLDEMLEGYLRNAGIRYDGYRYSDNYELVFRTYADAEVALSYLQNVLNSFELAVNPTKTSIVVLPQSLDSPWALDLSNHPLRRDSPYILMQDLVRYFDQAFKLAAEFADEPVLRYAIGRVGQLIMSSKGDQSSVGSFPDSPILDPANWSLLENLLLQSVTAEPGNMRHVMALIHGASKNGYKVEFSHVEELLNVQIEYHAPLGHSSEVAWALWCAIVFGRDVHKDAAHAVSAMDDSAVALLALDARERGRIVAGLDTKRWESFMTSEELYGEQWLLSYEASWQGSFHLPTKGNYVTTDAWFSKLKSAGVAFYDRNAPLIIPPSGREGPSGFTMPEAVGPSQHSAVAEPRSNDYRGPTTDMEDIPF